MYIFTIKKMEKTAFFKTLLNEVQVIHILHIQAKDLHEHDILDFYDELNGIIDQLIENDKSFADKDNDISDLITAQPEMFCSSYEPIVRMKEFRSYVISGISTLYGEIPSSINSIYDSLITLLNTAIYKLNINNSISVDGVISNSNTFDVLNYETFLNYEKELNK